MRADRTISHFLRFLRPQRTKFVLVVLGSLLSSSLAVAYPLALKHLVDSWAAGTREGSLTILLAGLAAALTAQASISYVSQYAFIRLAQRVLAAVRIDLISRLIDRPVDFFSREREGRVVSVFLNDINTISQTLTGGLLNVLLSAVTLLAVLVVMFFLEWRLTLLVGVFMAGFALLNGVIGPRVKALSSEYHDRLADVTEALHEVYGGIRVVKLFGWEQTARDRFSVRVRSATRAFNSLTQRGLLMTEVSGLLVGLALLVALAFCGKLVAEHRLTLGSAMAYFGLLSAAFGPLKSLVGANVSYRTAAGAASRIADLMRGSHEPFADRRSVDVAFDQESAIVEFRGVDFSYEQTAVLENVDFRIAKAERVLMRGPSGAGKSTIIDLMMGFQCPDKGHIRYSGVDCAHLTTREIRERIAVVPQDPFLFNASLRENLLLGHPGTTEAGLQEAILAAGLDSLISRLADGLDTMVGERGSLLSGGEKQRVAIARAILKPSVLVVFDEANAWLDPATERLVWGRLVTSLEGRAILLVSHKDCPHFQADTLLTLRDGRVSRASRA